MGSGVTLGALCLASLIAVTNHAGHVVRGELTSVTNGTFTVAGRTYPLSVLPLPSSDGKRRRLTAKKKQNSRLDGNYRQLIYYPPFFIGIFISF